MCTRARLQFPWQPLAALQEVDVPSFLLRNPVYANTTHHTHRSHQQVRRSPLVLANIDPILHLHLTILLRTTTDLHRLEETFLAKEHCRPPPLLSCSPLLCRLTILHDRIPVLAVHRVPRHPHEYRLVFLEFGLVVCLQRRPNCTRPPLGDLHSHLRCAISLRVPLWATHRHHLH